ncbi:MAG TPA: hypothetical protein EYO21_08585 [Candidatus Marinimicrobia bacterium]|nr:hypothetical protein [Candidatus Neomarinimicrobiota bacterium]HIB96138.1 hypothetical protein [Candidatus Neomarinimicrobiota bacterium]
MAIAAVPVQVRPRVLIDRSDEIFCYILDFRLPLNATNTILYLQLRWLCQLERSPILKQIWYRSSHPFPKITRIPLIAGFAENLPPVVRRWDKGTLQQLSQ